MTKKLFPLILAALLLTACAGTPAPKKEITVVLSDFAYSPNSFTVPVDEPILLTIINQGAVEHDFVIEKVDVTTKVIDEHGSEEHHAHGDAAGYDLHVATQVGQTSMVEFTVHEAGTYEVFCSVEGHKESGMIGQLVVVAEQ